MQGPDLDWQTGDIPVSRTFGDPYFSLDGGLEETRHVFLAGNGLPARLRDGFEVAELGFGTGLNLLALALAWGAEGRPGVVRFTSFEAFPLPVADMARALAVFPAVAGLAGALCDQWGAEVIRLPGIEARVIPGLAAETLPRWGGRADAWFLDGFAPAKNPEMWGADLMAGVARATAPGGTFATYTAAGAVRRALAEAGFAVERVAGYGRKRHMSRGVLGG